ncbi:MAG TPA: hypothetical protein VGI81_12155 [Tepidisphaeraceae bacterium]|jgi:flagellar motility protein MotE (MotC chaperone)
MKRLWDLLVLTLAMNFLLLAGAVGWLYQSGRLDKERVGKVKEALFPPTTQPVATTQPAVDPATASREQLDALLAQHAGLPAGQQVEFIRQTFDAQMAQLDRRTRELADLKTQIDMANAKLATDRAALDADRKRLTDEQERAKRLAADEGFQQSLDLYNSMPAKQVKSIFLTLNDDAVLQYLRAMDSGTAGKIIKEFKTPDELDRVQRILERMRKGNPTTREGKDQ